MAQDRLLIQAYTWIQGLTTGNANRPLSNAVKTETAFPKKKIAARLPRPYFGSRISAGASPDTDENPPPGGEIQAEQPCTLPKKACGATSTTMSR